MGRGRKIQCETLSIKPDFSKGALMSLKINHEEWLQEESPLFCLMVRDRAGQRTSLSAKDAKALEWGENFGRYSALDAGIEISLRLEEQGGEAAWFLSAKPKREDLLIEWIEGPAPILPSLEKQGATLLYPYNEGALVDNENRRLGREEGGYPSMGADPIFPNMVFAQMLGYFWKERGLYLGAHDPDRGVKGIDYLPAPSGVGLRMRLYCGKDFGEEYAPQWPLIWAAIGGRWEDAAERYRQWNDQNLPPKAKKIAENPNLPAWYADSPLVVTYPVRGQHDTDEMSPNSLFPYCNALPLLDQIAKETESRLMVILMHWEGTAPWAPPYTLPPYGGEKPFRAFQKALKERNHLLGVYCSGFGFTKKSNLTDFTADPAPHMDAFCADERGEVALSKICTKQRVGYDICAASPKGRELLMDAYRPLLESGVDYAQILDQNHGGSQYFCFHPHHGHPAAPGPWMTQNMQELLSHWNEIAKEMLLGCESAAAEPFIGNLLFSDNRFELNYKFGRAVPLYAYLYHEYLRNFMGNQVACPFLEEEESLPWRIGYSFAAGDCLTLTLSPDGQLFSHWGSRDFEHRPDKARCLKLIGNLNRFYREEGKPFLYNGRMIPALPIECEEISFPLRLIGGRLSLPALHATAWQSQEGARGQIIVNPWEREHRFRLLEKEYTIPPLSAMKISL